MPERAEQLRAVGPLARQELARRRLGDFLAGLIPGYERPRHVRALCEHLEALEAGELRRLIVAMPPRHGKTLHVSQAFPAWTLGRRPDRRLILASYAAELAESNSRRARGFLLDPRWPFPGVEVSSHSAAVNRWDTTEGGGVIAAGVRGGLTGHGADLLIVDDPVKDREEADSEAIRESTWRWWTEVALTRLQPCAGVLLMGTRWHEDDLIGRVLAGPGADEWTVLELPALAEDNDPLGRVEGDALWADRYNADYLAALREQIGERAFQALYQQQPTPDKGSIFERDWMGGRYDRLPEDARKIQTVDSAFKDGVHNDYSVIATWASDGRWYYVVDVRRARLDFPSLVAAIKQEAAEHSPEAVCIEDNASGQSAIQTLRKETGLPMIPVPAKGSKVSRAEAVSPLFEARKVLLPGQQPAWLEPWVEEHVKFPAGKHDDQVDTTSMALARLRTNQRGGVKTVHHSRPERRKLTMADVKRAERKRRGVRRGTHDNPLTYAEAKRADPDVYDPRYE